MPYAITDQIFDTKQSPKAAQDAILASIAKVKRSGLDCFDFTHRSNSGWVEGLNSMIKGLKRPCYGIANLINLFHRIWLELSVFGFMDSL